MPVLGNADIVAGNLESTISTRGKAVENKKFTLRAGPVAARALKSAGIRVVTLANNHSLDFGPLALWDTIASLEDNGILYSGAGMSLDDARTPAIIKIKGRTLAFLAYSLTFPLEFFASAGRPGTAPGYAEFVKADIEKVRPRADLVIVSFHWGAELLTAAKDYQIELGRHAIDWGADLVLGHHPHVLQELEVYKGRLIAYSLGNFVFGSESERTNTSMILLTTFQGKTLVRVEAVPLDVNNYRVKYRPHVLDGKAAALVLDSVNAASARFKTKLEIANGRGTIVLPAQVEQRKSAIASSPLANRSLNCFQFLFYVNNQNCNLPDLLLQGLVIHFKLRPRPQFLEPLLVPCIVLVPAQSLGNVLGGVRKADRSCLALVLELEDMVSVRALDDPAQPALGQAEDDVELPRHIAHRKITEVPSPLRLRRRRASPRQGGKVGARRPGAVPLPSRPPARLPQLSGVRGPVPASRTPTGWPCNSASPRPATRAFHGSYFGPAAARSSCLPRCRTSTSQNRSRGRQEYP